MIVKFEKEYLRDLFESGKTTDKQHRYHLEIVRKYIFCINSLKSASSISVIKKMLLVLRFAINPGWLYGYGHI